VRLTEIHFLRFDSTDTEERAYRAGQLDVTMGVPFSKIDTYGRQRPAELHQAAMLETRSFCFNTQRPPLDDVRVRRALALALDRDTIVKRVVRGGQEAAGRLAPAALREASALLGDAEQHYDPETARRLLREANVVATEFPRLEITAWSPSQVPVLEVAQHMWRRELGLEFRIGIREARVHWHALEIADYDIAYISAIPDVADITQMLGDYITGASDNFPRWSDRSFDDAMRRAVSPVDSEDRSGALLDAERRLLIAAPLTPVFFNNKVWLMSDRIHGWQEDGLWGQCFQHVYMTEK
jgi:oligopeptide transport system substrate-binding protein